MQIKITIGCHSIPIRIICLKSKFLLPERKEILTQAPSEMKLEYIMLTEISQKQTDKYWVTPLSTGGTWIVKIAETGSGRERLPAGWELVFNRDDRVLEVGSDTSCGTVPSQRAKLLHVLHHNYFLKGRRSLGSHRTQSFLHKRASSDHPLYLCPHCKPLIPSGP